MIRSQSRSSRAAEWMLLAAILCLALLLRVHGISSISYSFDEASSWKTIQFPWTEMFGSISRNVHPPVFYILLKLWSYVFGDGPVALRMFSVLFGMLTVWTSYLFVKEALHGVETGASVADASICAALIVAVSPVHVMLSAQARMYSLATFLAVLGAVFLLRILRTGGALWDWTAFTVAAVLLALTHYFGIFTAVSLGLALIIRMIPEAVIDGWTPMVRRLAAGLCAAAWAAATVFRFWLPSFLSQLAQVQENYWIPTFEWSHILSIATEGLAGHNVGAEAVVPPGACALVWAGLSLHACCFGGRAGLVAGLAALFPVAAAVQISLNSQSIIVWRYFLFAQTFVLLAWAIFIGMRRSMLLRRLLVVFSLTWFGVWAQRLYVWQQLVAHDGLQTAAMILNQWRAGDEPVLVGSPHLFPIVQRYADNRDEIFVVAPGYWYNHYRGGPLFRPNDYRSLSELANGASGRIFVVHGPNEYAGVPPGWREVRVHQFEQRVGRRSWIAIRQLDRMSKANVVAGGAHQP